MNIQQYLTESVVGQNIRQSLEVLGKLSEIFGRPPEVEYSYVIWKEEWDKIVSDAFSWPVFREYVLFVTLFKRLPKARVYTE